MDTPFRSGLEGVIVAETEISHVDGANGRLIYRGGYHIEEVADRSYEELVHLLLYGRLPDWGELAATTAGLMKQRELNDAARAALAGLSTSADPMDALRTVLSAQGAQRGVAQPTAAEAIAVTAAAATAVAACHRHRQGLPLPEARMDLGHVANFLYQLHGREPDQAQVRWLETYFVVTADHALSPSTFTAQIVGSTGSDLWSAIVAAVGALKGPAHGGATVEATRMLERVGGPEHAESFVLDVLSHRGRLMGFGHREYRRYDPRARILADVCQAANPGYHAVARAVEDVALRELARRHPDRPNLTNVDYFAGGVLSGVGIPPDFFTCMFAAARTVGWAAHVVEYVARGERIVSPASRWIGPDARAAWRHQ
ncbi:citrate/2-methylcitrate synthase [Rhizomonospora bruguierae]|uniref:citrate/2-methylcitrate synthase n=1 Tax=Rhizomonospora bruguierae TaxID=1581705 RepID=UPI001BCABF98|nr:citrate/2-methylcitrate synthase [Micromonospora sp. NBRC 107566]